MTPQTLKEITDRQVEKLPNELDFWDEEYPLEFKDKRHVDKFLRQAIEEVVLQAFEDTRVEKMEQEAFPKYKSYSMGQVDGHNNAVTEQREKQDNFLKNI